jgi:hypothetical protein
VNTPELVIVQTPDTIPLAERIIDSLKSLGWEEGAPPHVSADSQAIDRRTASAVRCSMCGRKGGRYVPMHRVDRYRALSACQHCFGATEI